MTIALVAHDSKKELMVQFCTAYRHILAQHHLIATGTTGRLVEENVGLPVQKFLPGGHGGGQQIMARIACEEVDKLPAAQRPSQYFAALTNMRSVGVMGDERTYDYAIALRAVTTTDFMTAEVTLLPTETITTAANRIVNEVKHINRVLFDYTTKPPATIEFE